MPTLSVDGNSVECNLIILDMDGTIIDIKHRFESMAKVRTEIMKRTVGDYATELWAKASRIDLESGKFELNGALTSAPRREDLMVAATAIAINGESWRKAKKIAEQIYTEADNILASTYKPVLLPGVLGALKRMKDAGFKLAVATNAPHVSAEDLMESVDLKGVFETIIGADEVEKGKPAPDMILLACERCECVPYEAVYVGDMPMDMEAGKGAGVAAVIAVKSEFFTESRYSDYDMYIDSYEKIQAYPKR